MKCKYCGSECEDVGGNPMHSFWQCPTCPHKVTGVWLNKAFGGDKWLNFKIEFMYKDDQYLYEECYDADGVTRCFFYKRDATRQIHSFEIMKLPFPNSITPYNVIQKFKTYMIFS